MFVPRPKKAATPSAPALTPQTLTVPIKPIPRPTRSSGQGQAEVNDRAVQINPAYIDAAAASLHSSYAVPINQIKAALPQILTELVKASGGKEPDPREVAFLMANILDEGKYNPQAEEGLNYKTASRLIEIFPSHFKTEQQAKPYVNNPRGLANHVYAGINGNGNEASGDGWMFRGQGLIQATGRANAHTITQQFAARGWLVDGKVPDFEKHPELLKHPEAVYKIAVYGVREGWFKGQPEPHALSKSMSAMGDYPSQQQYSQLRRSFIGAANARNVGNWAAAVQKATAGTSVLKPEDKGRPR